MICALRLGPALRALGFGGALCLAGFGAPALAQNFQAAPAPSASAPIAPQPDIVERTVAQADNLASGSGALLRGLDKIAGQSDDLPVRAGQTVTFGGLLVSLRECRYPADDPSSNAYAYLVIREKDGGKVDFEGWMIADSPALNALDHPRYDVWVMRCTSN